VFDTPWRLANRATDMFGFRLSESERQMNPILNGTGSWIPSLESLQSGGPAFESVASPSSVRSSGNASALDDPIALLAAGNPSQAANRLHLPGQFSFFPSNESSSAAPAPMYGVRSGFAASWVNTGSTPTDPLPPYASQNGTWRQWNPQATVKPVCRLPGLLADGNFGFDVDAEDDASRSAYSHGLAPDLLTGWSSTVERMHWHNGRTIVVASATGVSRGVFVSIDDSSGICTIEHQANGFLTQGETDFGASLGFSSGIATFGAPTSNTSHLISGGEPGRLYFMAYCHRNQYVIKSSPSEWYCSQCPAGAVGGEPASLPSSSPPCSSCPVGSTDGDRPTLGEWVGAGAGCKYSCPESRFGSKCLPCSEYVKQARRPWRIRPPASSFCRLG